MGASHHCINLPGRPRGQMSFHVRLISQYDIGISVTPPHTLSVSSFHQLVIAEVARSHGVRIRLRDTVNVGRTEEKNNISMPTAPGVG